MQAWKSPDIASGLFCLFCDRHFMPVRHRCRGRGHHRCHRLDDGDDDDDCCCCPWEDGPRLRVLPDPPELARLRRG